MKESLACIRVRRRIGRTPYWEECCRRSFAPPKEYLADYRPKVLGIGGVLWMQTLHPLKETVFWMPSECGAKPIGCGHQPRFSGMTLPRIQRRVDCGCQRNSISSFITMSKLHRLDIKIERQVLSGHGQYNYWLTECD